MINKLIKLMELIKSKLLTTNKKSFEEIEEVEIFYKTSHIDISNLKYDETLSEKDKDYYGGETSINFPTTNYYVLRDENNNPIGFVHYHINDLENTFIVKQLYVHKEHRWKSGKKENNSYGKKLMAIMLKEKGYQYENILVRALPDDATKHEKEKLIKYYENFKILKGKIYKLDII